MKWQDFYVTGYQTIAFHTPLHVVEKDVLLTISADAIFKCIAFCTAFYGFGIYNKPNISFHISSNAKFEINAMRIDEKSYIISITEHAIRAFMNASWHHCKSKDFLDMFGLDGRQPIYDKHDASSAKYINPIDIIRLDKTYEIYEISSGLQLCIFTSMLSAAIFHELTHIFNGHLNFISYSMGVSTLIDGDSTNFSDLKGFSADIISKTLEYDADCNMLRMVLVLFDRYTPHYCKSLDDDAQKLLIPICGCFLAFRVTEIEAIFRAATTEQKHPPPSFRMRHIIRLSADLLDRHTAYERDKIGDTVIAAARGCLRSYAAMTGDREDLEQFKAQFIRDIPFITEIARCWKSLYGTLLTMKLGRRGLSLPQDFIEFLGEQSSHT